MREFCNNHCIRILSWLAAWFGLRLVAADAVLLPKGWMMFDPALAKAIGINPAIVFQKIDGWVQHNRRKGKNVRNGRAWSYNSIPDWGKEFYWLHPGTVGRLIRDLESAGRLVSAQPNKMKADQTKHYSTQAGIFCDDEPQQMLLWPQQNVTLGGTKGDDDSSIGTSKNKPAKVKRNLTPTPARVLALFGGVGVFPGHVPGREMPEKTPEVPETGPARRDGGDLEDVDETRPQRTHSAVTHPPVAPPPFPDDTTERGDTTEEETKSSPDTKPVDVPQWAGQINQPALDIERLFAEHGDSLAGWYAYGAAADTIKNPVGFALAKVKQGLKPPESPSSSYIPDRYADFIEH